MVEKKAIRTAKDLTFIGLAAASLTVVKLALSYIANVELVTLLVVFYTLKLGAKRTIVSVNVFILCETFIYGFGFWVISYFIHWNTLVVMIYLVSRKGEKKSIVYALFCLLLTFLFGVQTSAIEVLFLSGSADFFGAVLFRYIMGLSFFAVHMASAFLSVLFILPPLLKINFNQNKL